MESSVDASALQAQRGGGGAGLSSSFEEQWGYWNSWAGITLEALWWSRGPAPHWAGSEAHLQAGRLLAASASGFLLTFALSFSS